MVLLKMTKVSCTTGSYSEQESVSKCLIEKTSIIKTFVDMYQINKMVLLQGTASINLLTVETQIQ